MCKCDPNLRTPFCGKPGCEVPKQKTVFVVDGKDYSELYGAVPCDDDMIYYMTKNGSEKCVSDHPELIVKLKAICERYFK